VSLRLGTQGNPVSALARMVLGRVTSTPKELALRKDHVLLTRGPEALPEIQGYAGVLMSQGLPPGSAPAGDTPLIHGISYDHLEDGDVVALGSNGYVRTLYRLRSPHNSIFVTDRCNSLCLMCSQPPKAIDDRHRIAEHLRLVELIDPSTRELGITGGEPTLLKSDLLVLIDRCRELLPQTALHMLSNGRLFYYGSFARRLAALGHPDLMIGVPLYSDIDTEHDYVVQSAGAFDETLIGLQNLGRYSVPIEIRIVIHRLTYQRLPQLARFIYRNLPFASQVVLMGLEVTGFTVPNLADLWIEPAEYSRELVESVNLLAHHGMRVSVYNHQLCVVPAEIWRYCRKSISDWKNEYLPVCDGCTVRSHCGGFFSSSLRRGFSSRIGPIGENAFWGTLSH
jgi:His-Xaa-Ser system radical SAM maturase HxsC